MRHADILICGAGICGLTLARELLARGRENILIFDKEDRPGRHASGRNSGVLHAGIYYAPETLKAETCIKGNRRMRAYCREKGLPMAEAGKVIVAGEASELDALRALYDRAKGNSATVRLIDEKELAELEPLAKTVETAIHSPETTMVDPRAVLKSLQKDIESTGKAAFLFNTTFLGKTGKKTVAVSGGEISYGLFVNAAGAHADKVAAPFGVGHGLAAIPFKGVYRKLRPEKGGLVRGNIYPVPDVRNPFLGVHFTRGISGETYVGPTAIPALGRENYGVLRGMDAEALTILLRDLALFVKNPKFRDVALTEPKKYLAKFFFNDARRLVKELVPEDLLPCGKVGIRPQLVNLRSGELIMDFLVERRESELHILNAVSPAFTASLAFAEMVADKYVDAVS